MEETIKPKFAELNAIKKIATILEPLSNMAQDRVFGYLNHWLMEKRNPSPRVADLARERQLRSMTGLSQDEQAKIEALKSQMSIPESPVQ